MAAAELGSRALAAVRAGIGHDRYRVGVRLVSRLVDVLLYLAPLPMLASGNAAAGKTMDGLHQAMEWALLVMIGIHVASAMAHLFIYRDRIMQRMLPG